MKTGVLLLNFGGPWSLQEVRPFLYRLFENPAILTGVPAPFRQMLAYYIALRRCKASAECYRVIGGKSPQLEWTQAQASGLEQLLAENRAPVKVAIGMLASKPFIREALEDLRAWGAERVILLPLFPQYSASTTGACFESASQALRKMRWKLPAEKIERWPAHPGYVRLLRKTIDEKLDLAQQERAKEKAGDPIHVLLSAHALPVSAIQRGDPYEQDIKQTVQAVTQGLEHPWSLCYQSRNDTMEWLRPYTEDAIPSLGRRGIRRVVVAAVSFVSDHIETLWELDKLYADLAKRHGITHYYRARSFNGDLEFPRVLRDVINSGTEQA